MSYRFSLTDRVDHKNSAFYFHGTIKFSFDRGTISVHGEYPEMHNKEVL